MNQDQRSNTRPFRTTYQALTEGCSTLIHSVYPTDATAGNYCSTISVLDWLAKQEEDAEEKRRQAAAAAARRSINARDHERTEAVVRWLRWRRVCIVGE